MPVPASAAARAAAIERMPKAELHVHLEGTLERHFAELLAERHGMTLPPASDGFGYTDLATFLAAYYPAMDVLRTENDFFELAHRYLAKASSQGVLRAEMFFDPQAHTARGIPFATVISGYRRAIVAARDEFGISADLIMCFLRDHSAEFAMATLLESLPWREWIIGVGLDSDERGNPPAKFAAVFRRARAEGYFLTMHCDVDQENGVEHIRQAIEEIGVDRIDHGTNILEDARLVALVRDRGIALTSCPLSNSVVSDGFKSREVLELLRAGVRVTINSDDPPYFGGYLAENLVAIADDLDLSLDDLVQLQRNAFEASWLSTRERDRFLGLLDDFTQKEAAA